MNLLIKLRHSISHILSQAIQRFYDPKVKLGIGPAIDNGFYYDFLFSKESISEKKLKNVEKHMKNIIKENQQFKKLALSYPVAKQLLQLINQPFKLELLDEINQAGKKISFYINTVPSEKKEKILKNSLNEYIQLYDKINEFLNKFLSKQSDEYITFIDLCEGPHIKETIQIPQDSFKLYKIAGAYWKGNEHNPMLTRIYGLAFENKEKLQEYLKFLEEAKKRDHRTLGPKLGLFTIKPDEVGLGLILWKPKGAILYNILAHYIEKECEKRGYVPVKTSHIGRKKLWEISGHWGFYNESMYPPLELGITLEDRQDNRKPKESEIYLLKPMNCPFHVIIYKDDIHSYKELPIRYREFGTVYRYEKKGELGGLTRVRGFTQDDAHIICRPDQINQEINNTIDFVLDILKTFGFKDIKIFVSVSDPNSNKYVGPKNMWELAESTVEKVLKEKGLSYKKELGEAAFYGPKIDFKIRDALGRLWQCSTIQFDFNLPERFDMYYINEKGKKERPFMIHRAIFGSFERFIGILIEHYGGAFPFWIAPEQIRIIPILKNKNITNYSLNIYNILKEKGYRVKLDLSEYTLAKKIRNAEIQKIPFMIVIGEKETQNNTLSVREYHNKNQYKINLEKFLEILKNQFNPLK